MHFQLFSTDAWVPQPKVHYVFDCFSLSSPFMMWVVRLCQNNPHGDRKFIEKSGPFLQNRTKSIDFQWFSTPRGPTNISQYIGSDMSSLKSDIILGWSIAAYRQYPILSRYLYINYGPYPEGGGQPWRSPNRGRTARYEKAGRGGWRKKCREGHGGGEGREDERRARWTSGPHRLRADSACWPFRDICKER